MIEELLVEQLRDLLHAEGQLVKALPKMAEAAQLRVAAAGLRNASRGDQGAGGAAEGGLRLLGVAGQERSPARAWRV